MLAVQRPQIRQIHEKPKLPVFGYPRIERQCDYDLLQFAPSQESRRERAVKEQRLRKTLSDRCISCSGRSQVHATMLIEIWVLDLEQPIQTLSMKVSNFERQFFGLLSANHNAWNS